MLEIQVRCKSNGSATPTQKNRIGESKHKEVVYLHLTFIIGRKRHGIQGLSQSISDGGIGVSPMIGYRITKDLS